LIFFLLPGDALLQAEEHIFRWQAAREHRFLPVVCGRKHVLADLAKHLVELEAGCCEPLGERRSKRTVSRRVAVQGLLALLGRELDQRRAVRRDPGEAAGANVPRGVRQMHAGEEGIVPASIDDDEPELPHAAHGGDQPVEGDRLILDIAVGGEPGIDGNEVIDAVELEAVAGEIDDRQVRPGRRCRRIG